MIDENEIKKDLNNNKLIRYIPFIFGVTLGCFAFYKAIYDSTNSYFFIILGFASCLLFISGFYFLSNNKIQEYI